MRTVCLNQVDTSWLCYSMHYVTFRTFSMSLYKSLWLFGASTNIILRVLFFYQQIRSLNVWHQYRDISNGRSGGRSWTPALMLLKYLWTPSSSDWSESCAFIFLVTKSASTASGDISLLWKVVPSGTFTHRLHYFSSKVWGFRLLLVLLIVKEESIACKPSSKMV